MPKFSIIIPVYNTEKYIKACLDSILAQSNRDFELIIVDDGSSDNSVEVIEEAIKDIPESRLIKNAHKGVCGARNDGIEIARGNYICFVDSDDILCSNYIERLSEAVDRFAPDVIYFYPIYGVNTTKQTIENTEVYGALTRDDIKFLSAASLYHTPEVDHCGGKYYGINSFSAWLQVYRRELYIDNNIRYVNGIKRSEDGLLNLEMLNYVRSGVIVKEQIYIYRTDNVSATRSYIPDLTEVFDLRDMCVKAVINRLYHDDIDAYMEKYYCSLIYQIRIIAENQIFNGKNHKKAQEKMQEFRALLEKKDYAFAVKTCGKSYLAPEDKEILTIIQSGRYECIPEMLKRRQIKAKVREAVKKPVKRMVKLLSCK